MTNSMRKKSLVRNDAAASGEISPRLAYLWQGEPLNRSCIEGIREKMLMMSFSDPHPLLPSTIHALCNMALRYIDLQLLATSEISWGAAAVPDEATTPGKPDEAPPNNPAVCPTDDEERK